MRARVRRRARDGVPPQHLTIIIGPTYEDTPTWGGRLGGQEETLATAPSTMHEHTHHAVWMKCNAEWLTAERVRIYGEAKLSVPICVRSEQVRNTHTHTRARAHTHPHPHRDRPMSFLPFGFGLLKPRDRCTVHVQGKHVFFNACFPPVVTSLEMVLQV